MKKLIMSTAIALMVSSVTQAAALMWSFAGGNLFDGTGSTDASHKYNGSIYLFENSVLSQENLYNKLSSDKSFDIAANAATVLTFANGQIVTTDDAHKFTYDSEESGKKNFTFYFAAVSDNKVYMSLLVDRVMAAPPASTPMSFQSQNNGSTTFSSLAPAGTGFKGAGYWSAVPEPTSALLMLLGMAGLAIRRRRA